MSLDGSRISCELNSGMIFLKQNYLDFPSIILYFTSKLDLNLRKKLVKCYIWSMAFYGAETWTLRAADQKYLESFEMWCWRRMERISWTDHVRNEDELLRVNEQEGGSSRSRYVEESFWRSLWTCRQTEY